MGITRSSRHKRRATGGKMPIHRKKRKYEMARQPAKTKLGEKKVRLVRGRGGNIKYRALALDSGSFAWASEHCNRKTKIVNVVYNASNNELVRTNILVKGCIVQVDSTPFKKYFQETYNIELGKKKTAELNKEEFKESKNLLKRVKRMKLEYETQKAKLKEKKAGIEKKPEEKKVADKESEALPEIHKEMDYGYTGLDPIFGEQFSSGRLLAAISSRPGQSGRADGYLLEGKELAFYIKKLEKKKKPKNK